MPLAMSLVGQGIGCSDITMVSLSSQDTATEFMLFGCSSWARFSIVRPLQRDTDIEPNIGLFPSFSGEAGVE
jgi:hypothetical protein